MREVEVKYRIRDAEALLVALKRRGIGLGVPVRQDDQAYAPDGWVYGDARCGVPFARLRTVGGRHVFTVKRPAENVLSCEEHETVVADRDQMHHAILAMGFWPTVRIVKTRRTATFGDLVLCVDELDGLGVFLEVERMVPGDVPGEAGTRPDPDGTRAAPNLITAVATTPASVADVAMTAPIQDGLATAGLPPGEHFIDAGYTSAAGMRDARSRGITVTGPIQAGGSRGQAPGYTLAAFTIDWDHQQATCPQGATSSRWRPVTQHGTPKISVAFPAATCQPCPARPGRAPTTRAGRSLSLHPRDLHEVLQQARAAQATHTWKQRYRIRAGVEGTIWQATHTTGIRTARYLGLAKTRLEHHAAAAINLIRLDAWWTSRPLAPTRTSHLHRLNLTPGPRTE